MPARRRRGSQPTPRPPGAGSVLPESDQEPDLEPEAPEPLFAEPPPLLELDEPDEPEPVEVLARFVTATYALAFAEQVMQAIQQDSAECYRAGDGSWWVAARLLLGTAREMTGLGQGRLYVRAADGFAADRGWGDETAARPAAGLPDLTPVTLLDLVRVAGLHRVAVRPLREACLLVPGYLVSRVIERAQDLRLRVTYQQVMLDPLLTEAPAETQACYAVWLTAEPAPARSGPARSGRAAAAPDTVPDALLAALAEDPFTLVCRPVERTLLIAYGTASPLSDRTLSRLVAARGDTTWLLAPLPDGCARVTWVGEPLEAAGLVQLGPAHELVDLDGTQPYTEPAATARGPEPQALTLVPAVAHSAPVDAMLVDDTDLDCLPLLLAGDPLADIAVLVRGTNQHLLTAPGGLLTELAVGEPLTCVGPGSVYVPLGYRLDPPVGPAARAALFRPDARIAQVILRDARLGYDLDTAEPLWRLWAGPVPELDLQLSRAALADLDQAAAEIGDPPRVPDRPRNRLSQLLSQPARPEAEPPDAWRAQARRAEAARDFVTAAQLYARYNEPLRAARMWERDAAESY
jgi:FtsH ternary system domain X7